MCGHVGKKVTSKTFGPLNTRWAPIQVLKTPKTDPCLNPSNPPPPKTTHPMVTPEALKAKQTNTRLLSDSQIERVAQLIGDDMRLNDVVSWIEKEWGIKISRSTVQNYPEIKRARKLLDASKRIETKETLDKAYPKFVESLTVRQNKHLARIKKIEDELDDTSSNAKTYVILTNALAKENKVYLEVSALMNKLYNASSEEKQTEDTRAVRDDRLSRWEESLKEKVKEPDESIIAPFVDPLSLN